MSEWYEADSEEIDLCEDREEVNVFVTQNYFGSVYVTLTYDQIKETYKKIEASVKVASDD